MYLFVSPGYFSKLKLKQLPRLVVGGVLLFSFSVQAESADIPEKSPAEAEPVTSTSAPQPDEAQPGFRFPQWPTYPQVTKEIIPPPPPGPYMSSALNDYSVSAPSFGIDPGKYEAGRHAANRHDAFHLPMGMFSPDIPWPKNLRPGGYDSPVRWLPENGYQYAKPHSYQQTYATPPPVMMHKPVSGAMNRNDNAGRYGQYGFGPQVRQGMNNSAPRWTGPSARPYRGRAPYSGIYIGPPGVMVPPGPYRYAPNDGSRYTGPAMNTNATNVVRPSRSHR